jgi:hypothetical protein
MELALNQQAGKLLQASFLGDNMQPDQQSKQRFPSNKRFCHPKEPMETRYLDFLINRFRVQVPAGAPSKAPDFWGLIFGNTARSDQRTTTQFLGIKRPA